MATETEHTVEEAQALIESEGLGGPYGLKVADVTEGFVTLWEWTFLGNVPGQTFESWDEFETFVREYDGADA